MPIFYSALLLTGVNLMLRLVSTAFQVYLSGCIGPAGIGLLQLVMSVGSLSMTAGMAGIRTATMYLTAEELGKNRGARTVLSSCMGYSLLFSGTVSILVWVFAPVLAEEWIGRPETSSAIRLYACFLPVVCLCGVMTGYFTGANRIGTLAGVEVAEQCCSMGLTILILSRWAGSDPIRACCGVILGSSLGACLTFLCLLILRIREGEKPGPRIPVFRQLVNTAIPLALADDLKAGISTAENLMVPRRLALFAGSSAALSEFGTVCGMVFPILMFPASILYALAELLIPELARCRASGKKRRISYLVHRSLRISLFYGATFAGLEYLLAEDLCYILYRSLEASTYLRNFSLLIPMLYCDTITDAMTKGLGQQKMCVRYNILTSGLDVIFLFLLLPRYGMAGYFFSFAVTHALNFALSLRRLLLITGESIPVSHVVLVLPVTVACVWVASHTGHPVGRGITFPVLLLSSMFLLGILGKEDLLWIQGLLFKPAGAKSKKAAEL